MHDPYESNHPGGGGTGFEEGWLGLRGDEFTDHKPGPGCGTRECLLGHDGIGEVKRSDA